MIAKEKVICACGHDLHEGERCRTAISILPMMQCPCQFSSPYTVTIDAAESLPVHPEQEEVSEQDCEDGPPCKHCGHPFLSHDDEWGSCGYLGKTETLHEVCDCPGYEESEEPVEPLPPVEASDEYIRGFNRCKELAERIVDEHDGFLDRIGHLDPVTSVALPPIDAKEEETDPCKMTDAQYEEYIYGPNRTEWPTNEPDHIVHAHEKVEAKEKPSGEVVTFCNQLKPTPSTPADSDPGCKFCPQLKSEHETDGSCYNLLTSAKFEPRPQLDSSSISSEQFDSSERDEVREMWRQKYMTLKSLHASLIDLIDKTQSCTSGLSHSECLEEIKRRLEK